MGIYSDLTDEQLTAELAEYRKAMRELATGGVAVIQGEGRRVEYARGDKALMMNALRALESEIGRRGLGPGTNSGAIPVRFS